MHPLDAVLWTKLRHFFSLPSSPEAGAVYYFPRKEIIVLQLVTHHYHAIGYFLFSLLSFC